MFFKLPSEDFPLLSELRAVQTYTPNHKSHVVNIGSSWIVQVSSARGKSRIQLLLCCQHQRPLRKRLPRKRSAKQARPSGCIPTGPYHSIPHRIHVNVTIYGIHGSYGYQYPCVFPDTKRPYQLRVTRGYPSCDHPTT